jgi:molybdenum cofactor cytidylyltransferase
MPRSSSFAGIVLAAGASSRMGEDKALLEYHGQTFLTSAIRLLQSACDFVIVVTGANTDLLRPVIYENSAYVIHNLRPEDGQFSSLRLGLQAVLDRGRDAACVTLVDRPACKIATLAQLKTEFLSTTPENTWAIVPEYAGKHGHPVLFAREMMEVFLRSASASNAREIEHRHQNQIQYMPVDDPKVVLNINTPEEYSTFLQNHQ